MSTAAIAIVLKGYPRLSETFIAQEIRGLEQAGFRLRLFSLRHPTDPHIHPVINEIKAGVNYLPEYLHKEPLRLARCWFKARRLKGYRQARAQFWSDLKRDFTRNRIRRFGQALVMAAQLPPDVTHLHAHFIHTPASVTAYVSLMTGLSWSCSAHAKDIWTTAKDELQRKLEHAKWAVTCTASGHRYLQSLSPRPDSVKLSYHGLDLARFSPPPEPLARRDGSDPRDPVILVSVCRAVPKKGLDVLLTALSLLPDRLHWRWVHIGGGGLLDQLYRQAERLGISEKLQWRGALAQTAVLEQYRSSDLFVLPCRITSDGDRDGLPNVIVEAQSQKLAVVSTDISGVPELITHEKNGLLVAPEEPNSLSQAIARLIVNPKERCIMGERGAEKVRKNFDYHTSICDLSNLFRAAGIEPVHPRS